MEFYQFNHMIISITTNDYFLWYTFAYKIQTLLKQ